MPTFREELALQRLERIKDRIRLMQDMAKARATQRRLAAADSLKQQQQATQTAKAH